MANWVAVARSVAQGAHEGQVDRVGADYFGSHVDPVAKHVRSCGAYEHQVAAAYLHDVVEDTDLTLGNLADFGFPEEVLQIVDAVTRRDGEKYWLFIHRVTNTPDAIIVKIADIMSNMAPERLSLLPQRDRQRLAAKYSDALKVLWEHYER